MNEQNELIKRRFEELEHIKKLGVNPYPHRYDVTHKASEILAGYTDPIDEADAELKKTVTVSIAGRISAIRRMEKQPSAI